MTQNRLYTNELENNPQLDNNIINGRPVLLTRLLSRSIENLFYYNFLIFFDKITH